MSAKAPVDYDITNWQRNLVVEDGVEKTDSITVSVTIRDASRPGESYPASYTIPRAMLDSFPQEKNAKTAASFAFIDEKVNETHYQWMSAPPPPPAPKALTRAQIAMMVTGDPNKQPRRTLGGASFHKGEVPKGLRSQVEPVGDFDPFGDETGEESVNKKEKDHGG